MSSKRPSRLRLPRKLEATRAGWCFVVIVFGVGFAALNTGNNLLYLVLSLLLGFLVLSGLLSESSLRGLRVERHLPRELFARAPNRIALRIRNDQARTPAFAISIVDRWADAEGDEEAGRCFVLRVGAGETADRSYSFEPPARGEMQFSGCRLSTRFPFGLFVKSVDLVLETSALAYPEITELDAPQGSSRSLDTGEEHRRSADAGDALSGLREYVEGDPVQRIHWRRSLRVRRLIVGEREGESMAEIEVLLLLPEDLHRTEVESRVSRAASEVIAHLGSGLRVGLRTNTACFTPDTGFAHRTAMLTHLARVNADSARLESEPLRALDEATDRATQSEIRVTAAIERDPVGVLP